MQEMPSVELPKDFWASLEHRIFHLRDGKPLKGSRPISSITSFAVACTFVFLMFFFGNFSISKIMRPDINLPAIVISKPSIQQLGTSRSLSSMFDKPYNSRSVNRFGKILMI